MQESSHKLEGLVGSIAIHAVLLIVLYLLILTTPNPPLSMPSMGGGGVELNYGEPDAGTGDLTSLLPTNPEENNEESVSTPVEESTPEEATPDVENSEEVDPTESADAEPIQAKDEKTKKVVKKADVKTTDEKKKDEPKADPKFTMKKSNSGSNSTNTAKAGEDKGKPGNPGNPNGDDEKGRFTMGEKGSGGGKGGGSGTGTGVGFGDGYGKWKFIGNPYPNDQTEEEGKVEFILTIDEDGNILNASPRKNLGLSPGALKIYIDHLKTLSVEPPAGTDIPAGGFKGVPVWYTINNK